VGSIILKQKDEKSFQYALFRILQMSLYLFVFSAIKASLAFYYFKLDFNSGAWNLKVVKRHQMKPTATPWLGAYR